MKSRTNHTAVTRYEALRAAADGRTQREIAAAMGTDQPQVSRWMTGATPLRDVDVIAAFEAACERPKGYVLRLAGYIDEPVDLPSTILAAPELDGEGRSWMLITYNAAVDLTKQRRERRRGNRNR